MMLNYICVRPGIATSKHINKNTLLPSATIPSAISPSAQGNELEAIILLETGEEYEERAWEALNAQPEIQRGLSRLADKIRANAAAGKFEEGGFGIE
ncbi:MAG TPA: hypothetical protein VGD98_08630 [Ktedonobacteraceae bacterium]